MTQSIVQCVPNFSEARRPEIVEAITDSISGVNGIAILDRHSDIDHNRTVITFAGPPGLVQEAAFRSIQKASQLINLNHHTGQHPRIGAADVVPIVPVRNISIVDCVGISKQLAEKVGNQLNIPVYLYEASASIPERRNLENIRRGEYESLKINIEKDPQWKPDFGPSVIGPAGATVIGARQPLIAFNVYLGTDDVNIANKIARAVRFSSGGLRFVKAIGVYVAGKAQVSMNLTDFHKTSLARVMEMVRNEAIYHGTTIHHSELVGLIPEEALTSVSAWYLQLDAFNSEQILENKINQYFPIQKEGLYQHSLSTFLDGLSSPKPTPAGGAASAYSAAMAASLVIKLGKIIRTNKQFGGIRTEIDEMILSAELKRDALLNAIDEDSIAIEGLIQTRRRYSSEGEKSNATEEIRQAANRAALVPLAIARDCFTVFDLALTAAKIGYLPTLADAFAAANLAYAALNNSLLNMRVNLADVEGIPDSDQLLEQASAIEQKARSIDKEFKEIYHQTYLSPSINNNDQPAP